MNEALTETAAEAKVEAKVEATAETAVDATAETTEATKATLENSQPRQTMPVAAQPAPTQPAPAQYPQAAAYPHVRKASGWGIFVLCLVSLGVLTLAELVGYFIGVATPLGPDLGSLSLGAIVGMLCVVILGGAKLLSPTGESWKTCWKTAWWFVAISAALMLLDTISLFSEGAVILDAGSFMRLIETALLCFVIGLGEEVMVRGIVLGGLLAPLGKTKRGVLIAIVLSSLYFGILHVDFYTTDFTDMLQLTQSVLKVLQTGVYGFALACIAVSCEDVFSISILHGLDDFLLFVPAVVLAGESAEAEYVYTDVNDAIVTIVMYAIMIALYLPVAVKAYKLVKKMPNATRGAFWDARAKTNPKYADEPLAMPAPAAAAYAPAGVYAATPPQASVPTQAIAPTQPCAQSAPAPGLANNSQNATAEDAATFSESTSLDMGMMTVASDDAMTS